MRRAGFGLLSMSAMAAVAAASAAVEPIGTRVYSGKPPKRHHSGPRRNKQAARSKKQYLLKGIRP